jgi:DNA-binding response OmpR family regulator
MITARVKQTADRLTSSVNNPSEINATKNIHNILCVDADVDVLNHISRSFALCAKHYAVFTAATGWEAVEILKSVPIDILLVDLHMTVESGYPLIDYARSRYSATRIYAMSKGDSLTLNNKLYDLGICGHISKPLRMEMIYSVIRI